jgi:glycosyltransferase involved in cell wall biosynthesis
VTQKVDVLLPAFNAQATIRDAITSLQRQSFANLRIIAIDDGSTDQTPEILADLARNDERLLVLRRANGGIVDALNTGLKHCDAEFVARQDADDVSDITRIGRQLEYLQSHQECVAVSGGGRYTDADGHVISAPQYFD